jgi:hypothetical protein
MSMHGLGVQSWADMYVSLPANQQKRLVEKAQVYIQALDRAIARVLSPTIGRPEGQFLVTDDVIPLYGVGSSPEEAMADYRSVVVEYYESLEADAKELGPALVKQLALLRQVFFLCARDRRDR